MSTSTSPTSPAPPKDQPPRLEGSSDRARRAALIAVGVVAGLTLLLALVLIGFRVTRAGALPGIEVGGVDVGGLEGDELRDAIAGYGREQGGRTITATRPAQEDDPRGEASVQVTAEQLGYTLDVDETVEEVLARGRQLNPLAALADHLGAFSGTTEIAPVERVDSGRLDGWVEQTSDDMQLPPQEGSVRFEGVEVVRMDPVPGVQVDGEALRAAAEEAALDEDTSTITIETETLESAATSEDVEQVAAQAERVVSGPVTLTRGEAALQLGPEQLVAMLRIEPGDEGLRIVPDAEALAQVVDLSLLETEPEDAGLEFNGGTFTVKEGTPGFELDRPAVAQQVMELATGEGERVAEAAGEEVQPGRTTEEVAELGITQQVSTFTTQHPCCQNRVQNIHRIADLVRGVIIEPGETFSVNEHVGERTTDKGFLPDGAIQDGEFIEAVGGGVSQFATTMFNAAFFGGYDIVEHKPHSQYISRYPEGREATLNFPNVDLKVRNNSPYGIYVDTSYTDTSITVTFYGTPWVEVATATSPRSNPTPPETIVRTNPELAPGQEVVVQEAEGEGFDVSVTRTLTFPDGRTESETFSTTYVARPRIVERPPGA